MMGRYIVIEGNDGTGKSTQVMLLAEWLREQGREVVVIEEPGSDDPEKSTPVANELRRLIKNGRLERAAEINVALFSAARRELWQEKIQPALQRGAVVLSARNYISTLAYQGCGEGFDRDEIIRMTAVFTDERYMQPDAMIILTLSDVERAKRIAQRGELAHPDTFESRAQDFQDRVNHAYEIIAAEQNLPLLSAAGTIDEVQAAIRQHLDKVLT
ncbi:MAG: dTMP kinase [Candidatus Saccharibacteria bacterium]|nr:dTMP kinase [Candidatus Saccharibacteria bacterium]